MPTRTRIPGIWRSGWVATVPKRAIAKLVRPTTSSALETDSLVRGHYAFQLRLPWVFFINCLGGARNNVDGPRDRVNGV